MVKVKKCPECGDELTLSGITLHYRLWHQNEYPQFKAKFHTWKLDARETGVPRKSKKK